MLTAGAGGSDRRRSTQRPQPPKQCRIVGTNPWTNWWTIQHFSVWLCRPTSQTKRAATLTITQSLVLEAAHPSPLIWQTISECFLWSTPAIDSSCRAICTICEEFCVNIVAREACFTFQLPHGRNPTLPAMSAIYQEDFIRCHSAALAHVNTMISYRSARRSASCEFFCSRRKLVKITSRQFAVLCVKGTFVWYRIIVHNKQKCTIYSWPFCHRWESKEEFDWDQTQIMHLPRLLYESDGLIC